MTRKGSRAGIESFRVWIILEHRENEITERLTIYEDRSSTLSSARLVVKTFKEVTIISRFLPLSKVFDRQFVVRGQYQRIEYVQAGHYHFDLLPFGWFTLNGSEELGSLKTEGVIPSFASQQAYVLTVKLGR